MRTRLVLCAVVSLLLVTILATGLLGSGAYFSDTETSFGNTFTAGTLDLKVGGKDAPEVANIVKVDLKPNPTWSKSYGGQWVLKNAGSIPGRFSMTIQNIENLENDLLEPEVNAGDTSADVGELGALMYCRWQLNESPWTKWGGFNPLNSAEGTPVTGGVLGANESAPVYLDMEFDDQPNDDQGQSDTLSFDIVFSLEQE